MTLDNNLKDLFRGTILFHFFTEKVRLRGAGAKLPILRACC